MIQPTLETSLAEEQPAISRERKYDLDEAIHIGSCYTNLELATSAFKEMMVKLKKPTLLRTLSRPEIKSVADYFFRALACYKGLDEETRKALEADCYGNIVREAKVQERILFDKFTFF